MAHSEACNVQFLDLSGVDEDEKSWILTSLQTRDSTVKGPWNKSYSHQTISHPGCNLQQNHLTQKKYDSYPASAPVVIPNHVNQMPPTVYPPTYQQPLTVYQQAFVPPVQYQPPIVATQVLPVVSPMVPVNTPIVVPVNSPLVNNQYTYPSYPVQINSIPNSYQAPITNNCIPPPFSHPIPEVINQDVVIPINLSEDEIIPEEPACNGVKEENIMGQSNENKSWASLFVKKNAEVKSTIDEENKPLAKVSPFLQHTNKQLDEVHPIKMPHLADFDDPNYYRMGETLVKYAVDHRITSLQPRGLINRSNYCYINSILQALLACPPVYNLLNNLSPDANGKENRKHTQIIDNMVKFVAEFKHLPSGQRVSRRADNKTQKRDQLVSITCDKPFEPYWIYKMLGGIRSDSFVVEGRQEDAEEFLGCLLNGLNDEMLELMKLVEDVSVPVENNDDNEKGADGDKDWQVIGPKNKGCVTRRTEVIRTPISDIFGGHIRSRLHRAGDQITDNIQPFFTLQLNIEKVNSVREALEALVCKNQLEGVTSSKTNEEVEAWQQVTIEELPVVLVLHLKCFDFKLDGCTKIIKALEFPVDLKIESKLLSSKNNYQGKEKQYKLFAVVYHDGKEATKGHYVTDAYHVGYASWLRYDDASVKAVQEEQVLKPQGTRVPYILFYRRCDTVRSK